MSDDCVMVVYRLSQTRRTFALFANLSVSIVVSILVRRKSHHLLSSLEVPVPSILFSVYVHEMHANLVWGDNCGFEVLSLSIAVFSPMHKILSTIGFKLVVPSKSQIGNRQYPTGMVRQP